jgi:hypothetical protein
MQATDVNRQAGAIDEQMNGASAKLRKGPLSKHPEPT